MKYKFWAPFALLVLALATTSSCKKTPPPPPKDDSKAFQGTWEVAQFDANGIKNDDEIPGRATWVFEPGSLKLMIPEGLAEEYTVHADLSKTPGEIELVQSMGPLLGATENGLCTLEGNTLKLCLAEAGAARPTTFAANAKPPQTLIVLQRKQ